MGVELNPLALEALENNQRHLDMDGVEVGVSRQALDELITAYKALATQPAREAHEPVAWRYRFRQAGVPWSEWGYGRAPNLPSGWEVEDQPLYAATPPDAAATIERLQEKVRNLTVLLDQQFGTPCAQIAYAAELASLREKAKADVAAEREDAARAGWNACRKSIYAVCEDVMGENDKHREDTENSPRHHFGRGGMAAAKSIARGFNSMEAEDDDNFRAAIRARAALTTEEGLRDERGRPG